MQVIKEIYALAFCSALPSSDLSSKGYTVYEFNDEGSREGFSYNTNLFSICSFMHSAFLLCQGFFSHPIMQLFSLRTPRSDISPPPPSGLTSLVFSYPTTSHSPPKWHQTSHPHHSLEILNTVQLWCFNTALNCDHDFTAAPWQNLICCTSIPLHYT